MVAEPVIKLTVLILLVSQLVSSLMVAGSAMKLTVLMLLA